MNAREREHAINYAVHHAWNTSRAEYAEWVAEQCRKVIAERPWSAEAETLGWVVRFTTRDAERFRAKAIDFEVEENLRVTDLDELARRLTQT